MDKKKIVSVGLNDMRLKFGNIDSLISNPRILVKIRFLSRIKSIINRFEYKKINILSRLSMIIKYKVKN